MPRQSVASSDLKIVGTVTTIVIIIIIFGTIYHDRSDVSRSSTKASSTEPSSQVGIPASNPDDPWAPLRTTPSSRPPGGTTPAASPPTPSTGRETDISKLGQPKSRMFAEKTPPTSAPEANTGSTDSTTAAVPLGDLICPSAVPADTQVTPLSSDQRKDFVGTGATLISRNSDNPMDPLYDLLVWDAAFHVSNGTHYCITKIEVEAVLQDRGTSLRERHTFSPTPILQLGQGTDASVTLARRTKKNGEPLTIEEWRISRVWGFQAKTGFNTAPETINRSDGSGALLDYGIQLSNGTWESGIGGTPGKICWDVRNETHYVLREIAIRVTLSPKPPNVYAGERVILEKETGGLLDVGKTSRFCGTEPRPLPSGASWYTSTEAITGWKQ